MNSLKISLLDKNIPTLTPLMDIDSLSYELKLYEKGDYNTLERILTPSQTAVPTNTTQPLTTDHDSEEVSIITSQEPSQLTEKVRVRRQPTTQGSQPPNPDQVQDSMIQTSEFDQNPNSYPPLNTDKRSEISQNTKKWIKIDTTLQKLKEVERELKREKRSIDKQLLEDIEIYGLKDITKGSHQLIPRLKKGRKKTFTKKVIGDKLKDFLNTMDVTDEVDELVIQAIDYLDNTRDKCQDTFELKHIRIGKE